MHIYCIFLPNLASRICRAICDDSWAPVRSARRCSPPWTWCNWSMILNRGIPENPPKKKYKKKAISHGNSVDVVNSFLVENERLFFWLFLAQIVFACEPSYLIPILARHIYTYSIIFHSLIQVLARFRCARRGSKIQISWEHPCLKRFNAKRKGCHFSNVIFTDFLILYLSNKSVLSIRLSYLALYSYAFVLIFCNSHIVH